MIGMAQLAEQLGYGLFRTFEHVIVPNDYQSKYPHNASGTVDAAGTNFIDPMIALTAVAAQTKTIRLGTGPTFCLRPTRCMSPSKPLVST